VARIAPAATVGGDVANVADADGDDCDFGIRRSLDARLDLTPRFMSLTTAVAMSCVSPRDDDCWLLPTDMEPLVSR
jgi:hypothetical protein